MKKCFTTTFLVCVLLTGTTQMDVTDSSCNFLKNLKYKSGKANIFVEATYLELGSISDEQILKKLEKDKYLQAKNFGYAVAFKVKNCSKLYYVSSQDRSPFANSLFTEQNPRSVLLHCTVFRDYKLWDYQFFVINKIEQVIQ